MHDHHGYGGDVDDGWNGGYQQELLQFRAGHDQDSLGGDDSGFCSPPLWKNNYHTPSQPLLSHHVHNSLSLSPKSRLQAITRGQRELMEMVKNLPESSYELTLTDLVEHHKMETMEVEVDAQKEALDGSQQKAVVKRSAGRIGRFELENRGLFLKMGFPFSVKSKKKNSCRSFASNGKVSPRPERDWWKKKFTGSSDSDSSRTSNNSNNSRKKKAFLKGCWPLFQSRRSKTLV